MSKFDKQILCIKRDVLFKGDQFEGFSPDPGTPFAARIKQGTHSRRRGDVEEDPSEKQLIGYALIVHRPTSRVYAFRRSSDASKYTEKRLHGNWSWGIGGHTEPADAGADPVETALRRELSEEVGLHEGYRLRKLGYINHEQDAVSQVHVGILYLVEVEHDRIHPADGELAHGSFCDLAKLRDILASPDCTVEQWSRIALEPLTDVLLGRQPKAYNLADG